MVGSQYMEGPGHKVGIVTANSETDPAQPGCRVNIQTMDECNLNSPDDTHWAHWPNPEGHMQVFADQGKKFPDGASGIGKTPTRVQTGCIVSCAMNTASGQELIAQGTIPMDGSQPQSA